MSDPAWPNASVNHPEALLKRLENLAVTDPILDPGHERRKLQLRIQWKSEHVVSEHQIVSQREIAIKDADYWTHPPELRLKSAQKAEEARKKWSKIPGSVWYQPTARLPKSVVPDSDAAE